MATHRWTWCRAPARTPTAFPLTEIQVHRAHPQAGHVAPSALNQALQAGAQSALRQKRMSVHFGDCSVPGGGQGDADPQQLRHPLERDNGRGAAPGVFNGDIGLIESIDRRRRRRWRVRFDDRVAAYAVRDARRAGACLRHHRPQEPGQRIRGGHDAAAPDIQSQAATTATCSTPPSPAPGAGCSSSSAARNTIAAMIENDRKTVRYTNLKELLLGEAEEA